MLEFIAGVVIGGSFRSRLRDRDASLTEEEKRTAVVIRWTLLLSATGALALWGYALFDPGFMPANAVVDLLDGISGGQTFWVAALTVAASSGALAGFGFRAARLIFHLTVGAMMLVAAGPLVHAMMAL